MKIKKISWGSIIIGLLTGSLLGWYISTILIKFSLFSNIPNLEIISIILFTILSGLFAIKFPLTTELYSFVFTSWVFFQILWDLPSENINSWKIFIGSASIIIWVLNVFIGKLNIYTAKKVIKNSLGATR